MVLHYANLVAAAGVDTFLIGSELRGLTRVRSSSGVYPGVQALVTLASEVKSILGSATRVTYGADWTEYGAHVVDPAANEVRFPLDALWASPAIDVVGIDYYAPLSDWRDGAGHLDQEQASSIYDRGYLRANVRAGEGYDWFYADEPARRSQARSPITDGLGKPWIYRSKDLWNWWSRPHRERVGGVELASPTAWVPQSKPIWLTEVGCPAVDKGANQPSVFPDPKSSENFFPHFSSGSRDDLIQRRYLEALFAAFDPAGENNPISSLYGGRMIDVSAIHLWTWDARPYPIFPAASDVWADAGNWQTGHWLTGRLGATPLDALVHRILADCGVSGVATDALTDVCDGYVVDRPMTPRAMIEPLAMTFAFSATATGGTLAFVPRGGDAIAELTEDDFAVDDGHAASRLTRAQETELPREVSFAFTDAMSNYRRGAVTSRRLVGGSSKAVHTDLALVTSDAAVSRRAEIFLQDLWAGRETLQCALGPDSMSLQPGDVVGVTLSGRRQLFEISDITETERRQIKARSIDPEVFDVRLDPPRVPQPAIPAVVGPLHVDALCLPVIDPSDPDVLLRLAISGQPWQGAAVWQSLDGTSFSIVANAALPALTGVTLDDLASGPTGRWDLANAFRVKLDDGTLASIGDAALLDGGNVMAIETAAGVWEIVQFADAQLVDERTYRLSRLLRGQAGSDDAMATTLAAGANVVLLNSALVTIARGRDRLDRPLQLRIVAPGRSHDDASAVALTARPASTAFMPLSPVHLRASRRPDGVHVSWIRRTRIDGDGWTGEVPLGVDTEAYRLDILSAGVAVRSLSCTAPQALYAAADELSDFGSAQPSLSLRVVQLSGTVGAGHAAQATLNV